MNNDLSPPPPHPDFFLYVESLVSGCCTKDTHTLAQAQTGTHTHTHTAALPERLIEGSLIIVI